MPRIEPGSRGESLTNTHLSHGTVLHESQAAVTLKLISFLAVNTDSKPFSEKETDRKVL
jgi:hypothetical protein